MSTAQARRAHANASFLIERPRSAFVRALLGYRVQQLVALGIGGLVLIGLAVFVIHPEASTSGQTLGEVIYKVVTVGHAAALWGGIGMCALGVVAAVFGLPIIKRPYVGWIDENEGMRR